MEAVCIMMKQKGKKNDKGVLDYWDDAKKLLQEPGKFLLKLEKYDRDNISEEIINKMKIFIGKNPDFKPEKIAKASKAAEGLCKWCLKIYEYHFVFKEILPLRQDLDAAHKKLDAANKVNSK